MKTREQARRWQRLVGASLLFILLSAVMSTLWTTDAVAADGEDGADGGDPSEGLGGYSTEAEGAPLSILLFEPVTPVPVDPGEPHLRADHAYVHTDLSTGPQGRALASSLWPGALIGDGFPTIASLIAGQTGQDPPEYPLKADARSPGNEPRVCKEAPGGAGMCSVAEGFEVLAKAQAGESPAGGEVAFGNLDGESFGRVVDGRAITTVTATAQDVNLLGGTITIDSVKTVIETVSDGTTAESSGRTTVSGLSIGGQGYTIDENGLRPKEGDTTAELPGLPGGDDVAENLGIEVTLLGHEKELSGARAIHSAGGLQIRVDLGVLREQADTGPVEDLLRQVPGPEDPGVPSDVTDPAPFNVFQKPYLTLQPAFLLSPEVVFILGNANSETAATEPLDLDFDLGLPGPTFPATSSTPPPPAPSSSEVAPVPPEPSPDPTSLPPAPDEAVEPPAVAPEPSPIAQPQPGLEQLGFEGIAPVLGLMGLAGVLAGSWGLRRVSSVVFGTNGVCPDGKDHSLPDLKGAQDG